MSRREKTPKAPPSTAALYLRVSTARQAESDLSIPDQRRQLAAYALTKGFTVTAEFVEPGNTATDDKRPGFQALMEAGLEKPARFDTILVHSFSRFFRDQFLFEFYTRKLARNGVRLVSITQELGDDPMGLMMRQMMALFDEYQSRENAKHTLRAMKENARQGFWNGARPPIGYRIVDAEERGTKVKKKLEVDPAQAEIIRLMFRLALVGDEHSGPMGAKLIATYLNARQLRTRDGGRWGTGAVHYILTRTTYFGEHHFNSRNFKTGELKETDEHVIMEVPAIIDRETFDAVQLAMAARSPRTPGGNFAKSPLLLAGIIRCGHCDVAMTLRTGQSGRYRYYTCASRARTGTAACGGQTVRMDAVDAAVIDYLENRLLEPRFLTELMENVIDRRQEWIERRHKHVADLKKIAYEAQARLRRLYDTIESGIADGSDPVLKDRLRELKKLQDEATADAERAERAINRLGPIITPALLKQFSEATRRALRNEDGTFRRDILRAIAQRVVVKSKWELEVSGCRVELMRSLAATSGMEAAEVAVPARVPDWRALQDSNLRPFA